MRLQNSTDWPDHFLRRMVSWCCRELGHPSRKILNAVFRRSNIHAFRGLGGSRRVFVRIGRDEFFPVQEYVRYGVQHVGFVDRVEALVGVTAHEVYHCWQSANGKMRDGRHNEPAAMNAERTVLDRFRANRDALLSEWSRESERPAKASASLTDRRAAKASADLARWQRKAKLAHTKIRKLKARVRYYERRQAADGGAQ